MDSHQDNRDAIIAYIDSDNYAALKSFTSFDLNYINCIYLEKIFQKASDDVIEHFISNTISNQVTTQRKYSTRSNELLLSFAFHCRNSLKIVALCLELGANIDDYGQFELLRDLLVDECDAEIITYIIDKYIEAGLDLFIVSSYEHEYENDTLLKHIFMSGCFKVIEYALAKTNVDDFRTRDISKKYSKYLRKNKNIADHESGAIAISIKDTLTNSYCKFKPVDFSQILIR